MRRTMASPFLSPTVSDPGLPALGSLFSDGPPEPLTAVFESVGSKLLEATRVQVLWTPSQSVKIRYRTRAEGGSLSGKRQVVAALGPVPDGAVEVEGPGGRVAVWVVPNDPYLPGLRSAMDPSVVGRLLRDMGFSGDVRRIRMRSYRPGRRALVEVVGSGRTVYLKVVRPMEVEALHLRHRTLVDYVTVPDSLGFSADLGVLALQSLPGRDLRAALKKPGRRLPTASEVAGLLERLPDPTPGLTSRSPIERLPKVMRLLGALLPSELDRLGHLSAAIGEDPGSATVPVHGDFHEAQVMVNAGKPVGVVDIDTFGIGRPGDDPATMLGHLAMLADSAPDSARVLGFASQLNRIWDRRLDPSDLRRRTAAVVLGLATGPFRVQRPNWPDEVRHRIGRAEMWVESARRVDEKNLILASAGSHGAR